MSKKRPSLASLADRLAVKPGQSERARVSPAKPERLAQGGDRRGILIRLDARTRKALKILAVERDTTVQALVAEVIAALLKER